MIVLITKSPFCPEISTHNIKFNFYVSYKYVKRTSRIWRETSVCASLSFLERAYGDDTVRFRVPFSHFLICLRMNTVNMMMNPRNSWHVDKLAGMFYSFTSVYEATVQMNCIVTRVEMRSCASFGEFVFGGFTETSKRYSNPYPVIWGHDTVVARAYELMMRQWRYCRTQRIVTRFIYKCLRAKADRFDDGNLIPTSIAARARRSDLLSLLISLGVARAKQAHSLRVKIIEFGPLIRHWRLAQLEALRRHTRIPGDIVYSRMAAMIGVVPGFDIRVREKRKRHKRKIVAAQPSPLSKHNGMAG